MKIYLINSFLLLLILGLSITVGSHLATFVDASYEQTLDYLPSPTLSCTPTPIEPSITPYDVLTPTAGESATPTPGAEKGDDSADANSCLHHDCSGNRIGSPANADNIPQAPPATGRGN